MDLDAGVAGLWVCEPVDWATVDDESQSDSCSNRNIRKRLLALVLSEMKLRHRSGIHIRVKEDPVQG